mmetsp:Transcript_26116/g.64876  ORF Transcript_26116/g.64876 Transcript_26116/m.64876 type:complete len:216 (-) Transcript_26116:339-986(-)
MDGLLHPTQVVTLQLRQDGVKLLRVGREQLTHDVNPVPEQRLSLSRLLDAIQLGRLLASSVTQLLDAIRGRAQQRRGFGALGVFEDVDEQLRPQLGEKLALLLPRAVLELLTNGVERVEHSMSSSSSGGGRRRRLTALRIAAMAANAPLLIPRGVRLLEFFELLFDVEVGQAVLLGQRHTHRRAVRLVRRQLRHQTVELRVDELLHVLDISLGVL